ncbi:STAS domain-containing protein [Streptomyces sp. NPDC006393]|uniref:STAS domain-containing protein n=1 Tax=Streptomyces sp. NPDC006393 TaxID=3156763 RepID=UPI0033F29342
MTDEAPSLETIREQGCLLVRIGGDMTYRSQPWLRRPLAQLIAGGDRCVVLDLTGVSFCDSAGLNVLLGARHVAEANGVAVALACVPDLLRRVLEMTRADQVLRVYATVADARAAFGRL